MFPRTATTAVLACALGVTLAACSSSPAKTSTGGATASSSSTTSGSTSGTAAADQTRKQVAAAFWALDGSLGTVRSTGGLGRFAACTTSSADSLAYAIEAGVQPAKGAKPTQAAFATSILRGFAAAGWKLSQSSAGTYKAQRDGLSVQLDVFTNSNGTSGSFTVQSGCVTVGSGAQKIAADYSSGQDDSYPQGDASAKPVPTTFPTPGD